MKKKNTKKPVKKPAVKAPVSTCPMEWLGLAPEGVDTAALRDYFKTVPELDVECWGELGVVEVTFPSKRYIDFEAVKPEDMDEDLTALMAEKNAQTLYFVSVEPVSTREEQDFLSETAKALNMRFVVDNETFSPEI